MKKIVRFFVLVGVVSFAAVPPALSSHQPGWCYYDCVSFVPPRNESFSVYTTYEECCSSAATVCPAGMFALAPRFGNPYVICPTTG